MRKNKKFIDPRYFMDEKMGPSLISETGTPPTQLGLPHDVGTPEKLLQGIQGLLRDPEQIEVSNIQLIVNLINKHLMKNPNVAAELNAAKKELIQLNPDLARTRASNISRRDDLRAAAMQPDAAPSGRDFYSTSGRRFENKMKISKSQLKQIIKEELAKVLNENAGGYYVKWNPRGPSSFHDPEGNEIPDLKGKVDEDYGGLSPQELVMATENLPEFTNLVNKEALETHKETERGYEREGSALYPDPDFMDAYWARGSAWDELFQLYLEQVLEIPDAVVVEAPEEEPELDAWDQSFADDDYNPADYFEEGQSQLKQIIKEELSQIMKEVESPEADDARKKLNAIRHHLESTYGPNFHTPIPMSLQIMAPLLGAIDDLLAGEVGQAAHYLQRHLQALEKNKQ